MSELPKGWEEVSLFDISSPKQWPTLSKSKLSEDGYPVYGANGQIGFHSEYTHEFPTILITCRGATCGTINVSKPKSWVNGNAMALDELQTNQIDFSFTKLALTNRGFEDAIGGSAQPQITKKSLEVVTVPLPPLNEQKRIVAKLDTCQGHIERSSDALGSIPILLEDYRASLLASAFRGDLTAKWREQQKAQGIQHESAQDLLTRLRKERQKQWEQTELKKYEQKGKTPPPNWRSKYKKPVKIDAEHTKTLAQLPNSWLYCAIDDLGFIVRGASPRPAGDPKFFGGQFPWLTVKNITSGSSPYLTKSSQFLTPIGVEKSRTFPKNTLLLSNSGATLGVPKILAIDACGNDGIAGILGYPTEMLLFGYNWLSSQTQYLRSLNKGAAQPNLNTDIIRSLGQPLPPPAEQKEIVRLLEAAFARIDAIKLLHSKLKIQHSSLTQSLLAKAFRGELVVQEDLF
ncbi:restriction endonuclease subunit S [Rubritalea sp.]|uniref:restriction endonuclease subunit S n=1 Tax=Rubritalea sp. TaxID=2109375 RepID=UPI003EF72594